MERTHWSGRRTWPGPSQSEKASRRQTACDSPVPEILHRGDLNTIITDAYKASKDKTEIHLIAAQYSKLLRAFNSIFTWPIIQGQHMPKSHHWARNFSRDVAQGDYVSKMINKRQLLREDLHDDLDHAHGLHDEFVPPY